jgi:hypothetical protein
VLALALLAAALAALALRPGWKLAGAARERRIEQEADRRYEDLVASVQGILDGRK